MTPRPHGGDEIGDARMNALHVERNGGTAPRRGLPARDRIRDRIHEPPAPMGATRSETPE